MDSSKTSVPDYIEYLLSPSTPLDFHVKVENPETKLTETIGVDKWMLIARSKVLKAMLLESELKHEKELYIADLDSVTFKNFLKFLYGYDNVSYLYFEDAVKLLNAAEKYDVQDLKIKLGSHIRSQLSIKNLLTALRAAPLCETIPDLWKTITQLIQSRTQAVLSHPQFLTASVPAVLYILQQECLNVPEIGVWRAAVHWARHQLVSTEREISSANLRNVMLPLLQHIRLCTLSPIQLCEEVVPTQILTCQEVEEICLSIGKRKKSNSLTQVCNETRKRRNLAGSSVEVFRSPREEERRACDENRKFSTIVKRSILLLIQY